MDVGYEDEMEERAASSKAKSAYDILLLESAAENPFRNDLS